MTIVSKTVFAFKFQQTQDMKNYLRKTTNDIELNDNDDILMMIY